MAIYHLEAKVISRGAGRSAVAASAYLSCSQIYNDYDGIQHDYTRKRGLVWQEVFLPPIAPAAWSDRSILWNAVEENEKTKDSRLAREFVVALPIELGKTDWQSLLTEFIQDNFVAEGMCADVAIHDPYPPGHNPHAHIMLTIRPLQENGKWQHKTEKEISVREGMAQNGDLPLLNIRSHRRRAGRNSINIWLASERCIWHLQKLRSKVMNEPTSIPKVQSMADRIQFLSVGTAMNSYSSGGKNGQPLPIGIWHSIRR